MQAVTEVVSRVRQEVAKVVVGQSEAVDQCILALLCRGSVLMEGVPGIAKTLTVKALARILQLDFQRVQCTSDLMPADILGTNVLNLASGVFTLHQGPVFTDLLLVDEVNRMPPRTQAALLESMEEHQVTIEPPLTSIDCRLRRSKSFAGSGFDLDEAQNAFVPSNQINFAAVIGNTEICGNNCVTQTPQVQVCFEFAAFAGQQMFRLTRR